MESKKKSSDLTTKTQPTSKGRRRAIIGAVTGVTAATVWAKPVVDSVILPAHAATTNDDTDSEPIEVECGGSSSYYYEGNNWSSSGSNSSPFDFSSPLDLIVPPAHADKTKFGNGTATAVDGCLYKITMRNNYNSLTRAGTAGLDVPGVLKPFEGVSGNCKPWEDMDTRSIEIQKIDKSELWVEVDGELLIFKVSQKFLPPIDDEFCGGG